MTSQGRGGVPTSKRALSRGRTMLVFAALVVGFSAVPASAQAAGTATLSATPRCAYFGNAMGSYLLTLTLRNDTDGSATIGQSQVTGAVTGPTGLAEGDFVSAGDVETSFAGQFPGDAAGVATVSVDLLLEGPDYPPEGEVITVSATVELDGRCHGPGPEDLYSATVAPTVVPVGGSVVVSGGDCPPSVGWNLTTAPAKWIVHVQLAAESHAATTPPLGFGLEPVGAGIPELLPGGPSAQTEVDPLGNWSVTLDLSSAAVPVGPGGYAIEALCVIDGDGASGRIIYDTPRITVVAQGSGPAATPIVVRPAFTG